MSWVWSDLGFKPRQELLIVTIAFGVSVLQDFKCCSVYAFTCCNITKYDKIEFIPSIHLSGRLANDNRSFSNTIMRKWKQYNESHSVIPLIWCSMLHVYAEWAAWD